MFSLIFWVGVSAILCLIPLVILEFNNPKIIDAIKNRYKVLILVFFSCNGFIFSNYGDTNVEIKSLYGIELGANISEYPDARKDLVLDNVYILPINKKMPNAEIHIFAGYDDNIIRKINFIMRFDNIDSQELVTEKIKKDLLEKYKRRSYDLRYRYLNDNALIKFYSFRKKLKIEMRTLDYLDYKNNEKKIKAKMEVTKALEISNFILSDKGK